MWEQSMQVEALRLLSAWWDASRWSRMPWGRRRTVGATATAADVLATPEWPQGTKVVADPTPTGP